MLAPAPEPGQRILVVRLSALGDCLHALPVIGELRRRLPRAHIGWAIEEGGLRLLGDHPAIDRFHVYPRRIGTNRPNPYTKPEHFKQLAQGLPVFENRHCGAGNPAITNVPAIPLPPPADELIPDELLDRILEFGFAGDPSNVPAPPCRLQGPYNFGGEITQYPHVRAR